ncbi:MAG: SiaB family protein kinase [Arcobacteraceae bacterium]|nr:SiaB family protein kinase [Arcobacteraceae bacterium]
MNINEIQKLVDNDGIVFLSYGGFLSQELISAMTEALEKEAEDNAVSMGISNNIFTIFIELSQNMMNYSKTKIANNRDINPGGLIIVSKDAANNYYIHSQNIVSIDDKEKIEPKLIEILSLDRNGIKDKYRELRRSGKNTHGKGGGIGFYEIAKRCDKIEYNFKEINEDKFYFHIKTKINIKKYIK